MRWTPTVRTLVAPPVLLVLPVVVLSVVVAGCASSPELNRPSTVAVSPTGATPPQVAHYDAQPLITGAVFGHSGPKGGTALVIDEGGDVVSTPGATTSIALTLYTGGDLGDIQLRYQLGVTTPTAPTSVVVSPGQGFVVDGRLIVLAAVRPLNGSTLATASVLVFPSSTAVSLARLPA